MNRVTNGRVAVVTSANKDKGLLPASVVYQAVGDTTSYPIVAVSDEPNQYVPAKVADRMLRALMQALPALEEADAEFGEESAITVAVRRAIEEATTG